MRRVRRIYGTACYGHRDARGECAAIGCTRSQNSLRTSYCRQHTHRDGYLKHKYGITLAQRDAMDLAQGGQCAICTDQLPLHVDHCHDTGRVRGLLCGPCNRGIGLLGHDVDRLKEAIRYLTE